MNIFYLIFNILFTIVYGKIGYGPGNQEWGYITVRPEAQMFFWLYKTGSAVEEKPLILWLQGGPGCSSTGYGNFMEIGPLDMNNNKRNYSWVKNYNVLFVDNPVGTGFSYVNNDSSLATTNKQVVSDLITFLQLFYQDFPMLKTCFLYVVGESYGGKFAIELALTLKSFRNLNTASEKALMGVLLIDSWISPIDTIQNYHLFLYYTGLIDKQSSVSIQRAAESVRVTMRLRRYKLATQRWHGTLDIIANVTNNIDFYNILKQKSGKNDVERRNLEIFMNEKVKTALDINQTWILDSPDVFIALEEDFMKSVTHVVEKVLEETNLKVFVVTGELDLIVNTPGTLQWISKLWWLKKLKWESIRRTILTSQGTFHGFKKTAGAFSLFWVKGAGHMVPADNPVAMNIILKDMVNQ